MMDDTHLETLSSLFAGCNTSRSALYTIRRLVEIDSIALETRHPTCAMQHLLGDKFRFDSLVSQSINCYNLLGLRVAFGSI